MSVFLWNRNSSSCWCMSFNWLSCMVHMVPCVYLRSHVQFHSITWRFIICFSNIILKVSQQELALTLIWSILWLWNLCTVQCNYSQWQEKSFSVPERGLKGIQPKCKCYNYLFGRLFCPKGLTTEAETNHIAKQLGFKASLKGPNAAPGI